MKSTKIALLALLVGVAPILALADDISNGSYSTTDGGNNASPPNGWPAGMFPNQVEPTARANMGAVKRWWERANPAISTTGSAGAYVLTPTNTSYPTAYTQGEVYCAKANFAAVGNDTLNVNGLGAKPIYASGASSISRITANSILSGAQFCVAYDAVLNAGGGGFQLISTSVAGLGSAAFQPSSAFAQTANNGSDFANIATTRTNLGIKNGGTTTITASNSAPSGSANDGDIWIQW